MCKPGVEVHIKIISSIKVKKVIKIFRELTATDAKLTTGALQVGLDATHASARTPVSMDSVTRSSRKLHTRV